ncbi:Tm-1-like ATP-binding domain-containing protein [Kribbella sp.]|uniref:Tm-1-like ATP-binding domain-containing protein n=1 Tax=Kribbella sp. TaxID=1871183 RepID=UPI002D5E68CE|nr:Tm-1-like ATP-binding domain-containing protein [Kribbella sp.]HZX08090.1 Tm-1-like ATP-binding domain-containing protein [Kribbella sp.]
MPTVVLLGTLDTKADEYAFVRDRLLAAGLNVLVVDAGVLGEPGISADVERAAVAAAAGTDVGELRSAGDRGAAVTAMASGAAVVVRELYDDGRLDGALALGGTGGTSIAATAFRELPLGVPKVIVSTVASGDTSAYVRESDLVLMPSVVDVAGVNRLSARILANAAAAVAGMVLAEPVAVVTDVPLLAASMFGVTTPAVNTARARLTGLGYEVLVFHMTGVGGRTLESHLGLTAGGSIGAGTARTLDDCAALINAWTAAARAIRPDIFVLCHGGPIAEPPDVERILELCPDLDGFYGASSMERLPPNRRSPPPPAPS